MSNFKTKVNIYVLYTALFLILSLLVFFNFLMDEKYLIILEIFCAGLSFVTYCKYNKKSKFATIVGTLIYTFSGYMLYATVRNPIAASATIFLPLMFLGVDKIFKKDNYLVFILASAISTIPIIWNIYPLYITTIFTFLYFIIKYFNEYKGKKSFCIKLIKTLLCYIVGVFVTSFLTIHTFNIFQNISIKPDFGFTYYDFNYYAKSIFMGVSSAYWSKAYIIPIVLTMLPISILNFKKNKENRTWLITFLVLLLFFVIPWGSYILNGFVFETNKWAFAFSFVLAYLVTINIRNDLIYSPREFKFVKKMLVLYLIVWFLIRSHIGNFTLISIILAFVYLIILLSRSLDYNVLKKEQQLEYAENLKSPESNTIKNRVKIVLVLALCANILFFSWFLFTKLKYVDYNTINPSESSSLLNSNYRDLNFEFTGKHKKKILVNEHSLKFTKQYKSFNLKISDTSNLERCDLYVIFTNLKFSRNGQYTITAKYNGDNSKQVIRDFVKTPNYIKTPDIMVYVGAFNKNSDTIKLTLTKGSYTYDSIKLIAIK